MNCQLTVLVVGIFACGFLPRPTWAQEARGAAELALDSLLMMPVSTASKYEQKQSDAPAFITIVTHDEIQQFGYRTLEEILQNQTGFYTANDRQYGDVGFRGIGRPAYYNNKILVLVDGHSVNDAMSGGARLGSAGVIDLDDLERVEIVRGPGSALYGARAMLAVVNMVTRKGRDLDGLELMAGGGTQNALEAEMRYGRVLTPAADIAASVSWASRDGEDIYFPELDLPILNDGVAEGLDWERYLRGLVTIRYGDLFIQGAMSRRSKGIPTGAYGTEFNARGAESRDGLFYAELRYVRRLGPAAEFTVRGFADSYRNDGFYPFSSAVVGSNTSEARLTTIGADGEAFGSEAQVRWDPGQNHRLVFGLEGFKATRAGYNSSEPAGTDVSGSFPYSIVSGFFQEEFQVTPAILLTVGLRHDEYSTSGSATTPRGALVFHPSESTTIKFLAGAAYRAPNILEMHVHSRTAAVLGNVDLESERIRSFEVIWEQRLGGLATTVSAFHNEIRDLIALMEIPTPDSLTGYGSLVFKQQNISNARSAGVEVEARMALPLGVLARAGYGFQAATDRATSERLVNAPRHLLRLSVTGSRTGWGRLGLNIRAESGRRTLYYTETDRSVVVDLNATSRPFFARGTLQLTVKNLLNTEYATPGGFQHVQSSIPQRGRTIILRTKLGW